MARAGAPGAGATSVPSGGLLEEWMNVILKEAQSGSTGTPLTADTAVDYLKQKLMGTWKELEDWLTHEGSNEMGTLCEDAAASARAGSSEEHYRKNLCKGIAEIKYFMNGIGTRRTIGINGKGTDKDDDPVITTLDDAQAYPRCIVGSVALNELYGDHCKLNEVIGHVSDKMEMQLRTHAKAATNFDKCAGITRRDIMFGRTLLHDEIKRWAGDQRKEGENGKGNWRVAYVWKLRGNVCKEQKKGDLTKLQQQRKENAAVTTNFLKLDNRETAGSSGGATLAEVLSDGNYKLDTNTLADALNNVIKDGKVETANVAKVMEKLEEATQKNIGAGSGLLEKWLQHHANGLTTGKDLSQAAKEITEKLKSDLNVTWEDLRSRLGSQESTEIAGLCGGAGKLTDRGGTWEHSMKEFCKGMVEVRYFTSGVKKGNTRSKVEVEAVREHEWYPRCIVAAVTLSTIYGNHCKLGPAVDLVKSSVEGKLKGKQGLNDMFDKCKGLTDRDILFGKSILGDEIKSWAEEDRGRAAQYDKDLAEYNAARGRGAGGLSSPQNRAKGRVGVVMQDRRKFCKPKEQGGQELNAEEQLKVNTKSMASFLLIGDSAKVGSSGSPNPFDILVNDELTLKNEIIEETLKDIVAGSINGQVDSSKVQAAMQKLGKEAEKTLAEACMKDSSKEFCQRLQCAQEYWKLKNNEQGQPDGDFWGKHAEDKLKNLFDVTTSGSSTTTGTNCDTIAGLDTANKAACKLFTAKLEHMYKNGSGGSDKYSDQMVQCLLLNAYAKKLKDQAKEKGYCSIDKGLQGAFSKSKEIMNSASGKCGPNGTNCFECKWDEKTEGELDKCTIPNGTGPTKAVNTKVVELFQNNNQTNKDEIQKTLANFNKENKLCERVNCAAHWWADKNKGKEHTDMWTEVQKQINELGKSMSDNQNNSLDSHCGTLSWKQKEVCLLFAKGLKYMYENTNDNGNDPAEASFKRTMMCAALNAYANKLKEDAKTKGAGKCDIEGGIKGAFEKSSVSMGNGASPCNDDNNPGCFKCTWDDSTFKNCKIDTNGNTGKTEVNNKLEGMLDEEDTGLKESLDKICLPCLDKDDLCERFQCVSEIWLKQKNGNSGKPLTTDDWKKVWEGADGVKGELGELSQKIQQNKSNVSTYCSSIQQEEGKEVCEFIAAGLESIYEIKAGQNGQGKSTKKDLEEQLFKRTMRCVLLNAFADKLEQLPCKDEKKVKDAIDKAFNDENDAIKTASEGCKKDGDKCFKCVREKNLMSCTLNSGKDKVNEKVQPMLEKDETLKKESLEKKICKPCTGENNGNFCTQLKCVADKWGERNKAKSNGTVTWNDMESDLKGRLGPLLTDMNKTQYQDPDGKYCTAWSDNDAHGVANKTACKLVAAGLQHISSIQESYSNGQENPYDNQEFKQLVSCLMLKGVVQKMKEDSNFCNIEPGINRAFEFANAIKEEHCTNDKLCIECKFTDSYDDCQIGNSPEEKVKDKLDSLLKDDKHKDNVEGTLTAITKTPGNSSSTLCLRLQCLASRVNASPSKNTFWEKNGEVGNLWTELSKEMNTEGTKDQNGCDKMEDNNGRDATKPERKACNYLHVGLRKLYDMTKGSSTTATPSSPGNEKILDKNPLLKQTVGCLLLHSYAKKMKEDAKCLVGSGIKKAFDTAVKNLNGSCNGTEPCVPCHWQEADYDKCQITITGTSDETTQTPVKDKLEQVQPKIDVTATETLTKINEMTTLCDYIRCAGPKWFKNKKETNGTSTQTWCDFWNDAVKTTLEGLFQKIEEEGMNNATKTDGPCKDFGDGNADSVERKACNHITAGLKYIDDIKSNVIGGSPNDQLLQQAVGCIALNLYADKIKQKSKNKCPIDEIKITEMFNEWNIINNSSCLTGSGNNNCFLCTRQPDFEDCNLLVDKDLIGTSTQSNGTCNDSEENKKVQEKMTKLLQDNSINTKMQPTLEKINKMDTFCSRLQCAAKQYYVEVKNKNGNSSRVNWNALKEDIGKELTALLNNMNDAKMQSDAAQYCNDGSKWNTKGHTERRTNRAACLHFAAGLQHIYKNKTKGPFKGPSFEQTMGCLFLKEYAKQLKDLAKEKKKGHSWVHPKCDIKEGIDHAFGKSKDIMKSVLPQCSKDTNGNNSCFVCTQNNDYGTCKIGIDSVKDNVEPLLKKKSDLMEKTLENTVCPILLTDLLTPFLPLAPVSIGLSAMAYYLWKYFGPLGKGGARFRRSPAEIRGPSVQEQVLDHVQQDGPHEYQLVKERKPRSAPTRTKRSGPVNRRTIIEIHFEVLDECQKGDTQLNQKDFLELLVQEFMGSEFMEEEKVPKEEVPMELVPIEEVPSLGSGLLV
ncbi:SICAvar, type I [Plasmodium knowlesi strain H]|uniref:SICAvar, type I n=1 Tax=Plasmodium knowlesi (strain H) TaxID=5851 RepID=A0A679L1U8_PLAKH|nr:SICAvar, type I [Plasmodium knowlesi strain H]CAA9986712.1 SICAvar, type I [Plasmodium knowlesi strain H]VVS76186.1 SICAvar, type I [Plasmodium knowlesi strain H]